MQRRQNDQSEGARPRRRNPDRSHSPARDEFRSPPRDRSKRRGEHNKPEESHDGPKLNPNIQRNAQGGIYVHEQDIETLFKFIDSNSYGRITLQDLKNKVSLFARDMTSRDFKFLMAGKNEMTVKELYDILKYNELDDFDPVAEAFKFYDPNNTGYVDLDRLREIFALLGYGELSYGDMQILVECADADCDGKISLEDFRKLIPVHPIEGEEHTEQRGLANADVHDQFIANLRSE